MKVIVTKLVSEQGSDKFGGKGRVDFYHGEELLHSEYFEGKLTDTEFGRPVDYRFEEGIELTAKFVSVEGTFEGRIEQE